ncbi:MAG: ATPase, T2SS/T4P/T4SS family [Clostridia bacterium]
MFENIKDRKDPLGIDLIKRGLVSQEQVDTALAYQKEHRDLKMGEIIDLLDMCDKTELLNVIAEREQTKAVMLDKQITIDYADYLPRDIVLSARALPFEVNGNRIKVAFSDPKDVKRLNEVKLLLLNKGYAMEPYVTLYTSIMRFVNSIKDVKNKYVDAEEKDITILVDNIIMSAMEKRTSDIHIEPMKNKVRIRYRIDGELVTVSEIDKKKQNNLIGRIKAVSNMHQEITYDQDGAISTYQDFSIRVSSQRNVYGEKFVLRLIKKDGNVRDIFDLGFPRDPVLVDKAFNKKNSIIIVCAPTGEGKTTTLYSVLGFLNKPEINIITIEDPVEIRLDGLSQVEIGNQTTFAGALRTVLRQDPDIILVGEIRDFETAKTALEAGQTGHLVLSTVHTIDAVEAITRVRKMGISDYDISSTFATTISQRLIRRLCEKCKKPAPLSEEDLAYVERVGKIMDKKFDIENSRTYTAVGCPVCNNVGYIGRIAMFEILSFDEIIRDMVSEGKSTIEIREYAMKNTIYEPMIVDGIRKVLAGVTTLSEVQKKVAIG